MPKSNAALNRELQSIRKSFRQLATAFSRLGPALAAQAERAAPTSTNGGGRKKPNLSAKQRAALKLQGKYMGTMRGLPAAKRAKVKKVRAEKGIRAAIRAAERMAG